MKRSVLFTSGTIILLSCILLVLWPLLRPGFFVSDDGEWMVIRLSAFYQSLASGQFPVRFLGRLNHSYGYPVANFLYPGFLYIGSLLRFVGIPFPEAIKLILGLSVVGGTTVLYGLLRKFFRPLPSVIGAASFVLAPYLSYDIYQRGSVGEVLAMFFGILSWYSIVMRKYWFLAISICLLIISHNTAAILLCSALGLIAIVQKKNVRLLASMFFGVGMSAFFWVPAIFERGFVQFDSAVVSQASQYFVTVKNLGLISLPTIAALLLFYQHKSDKNRNDSIYFLLAIVGIVMAIPISSYIWHWNILEKLVQFPFRFLLLPTIFGSWIIASLVEKLSGFWRHTLIGIFLLVWLAWLVPLQRDIEFVNRPLGFYVTNEGTTTVANEYMPIWVTEIPKSRPIETLEIIDGDAAISVRTFTGESMDILIDAKETSILQINKIFYPGWGVAVDGIAVPIDRGYATGIMRVEIPGGNHRVIAAFRETPLRFTADIVSVLSFVGLLIFLYRYRTTS